MDTPARLTPEELRLFSARIEKHLAEFPILLEKQEHLEKVADLLKKVGDSTLYDILGVEMVATWQDIHEAYRTVASRVHPSQAYRLGMIGREGVFELLFERVTEAYLVLSQPDRRKQYDQENRSSAVAALSPEERAAESKAVARRHYDRAVWLAEADDLYFAIELLRQAVRLDKRPDYLSLLGRLEAKNPRWRHHAIEHLEEAMQLGSSDGAIPALLEEIRAQMAGGLEAEITGPLRSRSKEAEVEVLDPEDAEGSGLDKRSRRPRR